ncbi:REP element-mobilizing transposase RayT [Oceanobacillus limi]|uniref:REP element-mobilizing transposase RayT n=1 Tax=Oceanobacillus limi TaxID=930131 RepID=A0A1I0AHT7_9BACI|nr:transposase [Oceanobacillus limi]SES93251.1 REP element-mobilizing transposase RayT [Oceanobacillus limi]
MPRKTRVWVPDYYYHIGCRGNRKEDLFKDDHDFQLFLQLLQKVKAKTSFELASYCLMSNHYHLLLRSKKHPISKVMFLLNKQYADYYNKKYELTGHVFEKRYFDKLIGDRYGLLRISQYIHLNPVEAGLVKVGQSYPWSSYRDYLNAANSQLLNTKVILDCFPGGAMEKREGYKKFVEMEDQRLEVESVYE